MALLAIWMAAADCRKLSGTADAGVERCVLSEADAWRARGLVCAWGTEPAHWQVMGCARVSCAGVLCWGDEEHRCTAITSLPYT